MDPWHPDNPFVVWSYDSELLKVTDYGVDSTIIRSVSSVKVVEEAIQSECWVEISEEESEHFLLLAKLEKL